MDAGRGTGPYIPRSDAGKRDWFTNFAGLVGEDPAAYGFTAADAAYLDTLASRYEDLLGRCQMPVERMTSLVAAKNDAREAALGAFRQYAMMIKANPAIEPDRRRALGLHLDDPTPTRVRPPRSHPVLLIVKSMHLRHTLRYQDNVEPLKRAKPRGAQRLELFVEITEDGRARGPEHARYLRSWAKQPIQVEFDARDGGEYATSTADGRPTPATSGLGRPA